MARYGIRANAVLPGWIATDMTAGGQANPKFVENVISRVPMKRWGEPQDFGGIAVYHERRLVVPHRRQLLMTAPTRSGGLGSCAPERDIIPTGAQGRRL